MKLSHRFFSRGPWVMFRTWCLTFRASRSLSLCFCLPICKTRASIFTQRQGFVAHTARRVVPFRDRKQRGQSVPEAPRCLVKVYTPAHVLRVGYKTHAARLRCPFRCVPSQGCALETSISDLHTGFSVYLRAAGGQTQADETPLKHQTAWFTPTSPSQHHSGAST